MRETMSTNEIIALFKQKPEIDFRINYFREILIALDAMMKGINRKLKVSVKDVYLLFGFIPLFQMAGKYDRAKLKKEYYDLDLEIYQKKNFYEIWLQRKNEYETKFELMLKEMDAHFDWIIQESLRVSEKNLRLANAMAKYKNENKDVQLKLEYYLYLKQEVENEYSYTKRRFVLQKIEKE